jgi:Family of unknown function (DUF5681)
MSGDFDVGYKKPPKRTQFRKGQSGNPQGRPKGTKNLKTDLIEEMQEQILVREGSRERKISKQRAMLKSMAAQAIKGNTKATSIVLGLLYRLTHADATNEPAGDLNAEDLAIIEGFTKRAAAKPTSTPDPDNDSNASKLQPAEETRPTPKVKP